MLLRIPRFAAHKSVCIGGWKKAWCTNLTLFWRCVIVCTLCMACSLVGVSSMVLDGMCASFLLAARNLHGGMEGSSSRCC